jgi:hypothetical protein
MEKSIMQNKNQHYIPQFYLKKFEIKIKIHPNEKPSIFVYDKLMKVVRRKAIKNVGNENHLYTIRRYDDSGNYLIEKTLSNIEGIFSNVLNKIESSFTNGDFNYKFSDDDKLIITFFILWQIKRTPPMIKFYEKLILETISSKENLEKEPEKKSLKNTVLLSMYKAGKRLGITEYILNRSWNIIYITNDNLNLVTSDNLINYRNLDNPNEELSFILNKKIILILQGKGSDKCYKIESQDKINDVNITTFNNATRYVFSHNQKMLEELSNSI